MIIQSKKEYHAVMVEIYRMMDRGEDDLTAEELRSLAEMTVAAERFEDEVMASFPLRKPKSIREAVELKMFEMKITQAKLAEMLGMAKSKLSEILTGKRQPDVAFLKALHMQLKMDAAFLLEHA